jgi:hypothetical protein
MRRGDPHSDWPENEQKWASHLAVSVLYTASCRSKSPKNRHKFFPVLDGNQAGRGVACGGGCNGRGPPVTFNTGEIVRVTFQGKSVAGEVLLASDNGLSLALLLQAHLEGYSRLMPVMWLEDHFVDLLLAEPVTICPLMAY